MFKPTTERQKVQDKVDVNNDEVMDTCIEQDQDNGDNASTTPDTELETFVVTPRPKREAAQKANTSIHSLLVKKPSSFTLTMPNTPVVLK